MTAHSSNTSPWLAYCRTNHHPKIRLFCFPFAGGGASIYRPWAKELPEAIDVCPIQLPGRETRIREQAYTCVNRLADAACDELLPYLDMPFAFFGHSMGALIAFAVARRLRRSVGKTPSVIISSGAIAPHLPNKFPLKHDMPEDLMIDGLGKLDGTPKAVLECPELLQLVLPILRADLKLCQCYEHLDEEPLDCPITAYGGLEDEWTTRQEIDAWQKHTSATFNVRMFPGGHFFIQNVSKDFFDALARDLTEL